jgi:hypothetical protein
VPIVALAIPLSIAAGAVMGTAVAICRDGMGLWYLVDHATGDGAPLWVHEGQIDRCAVAPIPSRA